MSLPWNAERPERMIRLTMRGGMLLGASALAFSCAYLFGWDALLIIGGFTGVPPLLALWFVRKRRPRMSARRVFSPRSVSVGQTATVRAELANLSASRTAQARWRDILPWRPGSTPAAPLASLGGAGRGPAQQSIARLHYEITPPRRGIVDIGPMIVDFADPFGLARGEFVIGTPQKLVVPPEAVPLTRDAVGLTADSGSARRFQRRAIAGDDDLMTREYRPGDALRRVHWRASAHHGELMVREEEQRSLAEALIVLETRRVGYPDAARNPGPDEPQSESFEWALRMTASLSIHLGSDGFLVRVIETAPARLASAGDGDEFMESLASIQLSYSDGDQLELAPGGPRSDTSLGSVFAILGDPDAGTIRRLADQRTSFNLASAFLVAPRRSDAIAALTLAGWRCVAVEPGDSVTGAWGSLDEDGHNAG